MSLIKQSLRSPRYLILLLGIAAVIFMAGRSRLISQGGREESVVTKPSVMINPGEVGEVGFVTVEPTSPGEWTPLEFSRAYEDPVVLVAVQSGQGKGPVIARVKDVTYSGCEIRLFRAKNTTGWKPPQTVAYLVIESGHHVLADGTVIDAGHRRAGGEWESVDYRRPLPATGRVICQVVTAANSRYITPRIKTGDRLHFRVRLQHDEAREEIPVKREKVAWVAISRGACATDTTMIQSGKSGKRFDALNHRIRFNAPFPSPPAFFANVASNEGKDPAIPRIKDVRTGDAWIGLEEDVSADDETGHVEEHVHWLAVSPGVISTVQTDSDGDGMPDPCEIAWLGNLSATPDADPDGDGLPNGQEILAGLNPKQFDPAPLVKAWARGIEQSSREQWTKLTFGRNLFSNPVVVATVQTSRGGTFATPRIRRLNSLGFDLRLEECLTDDGIRESERVAVLAVEAGRHMLPDGLIYEAGKANVGDGGWRKVVFSESFGETPVILTQVFTMRHDIPVVVRVDNADATGFQMKLREEQALIDEEHRTERVAWIALTPGTSRTFKTRVTATHLALEADDVISTVPYEAVADAPSRTKESLVFAQMQSANGPDTVTLALDVEDASAINLRAVEEQSEGEETQHAFEDVGIVTAPSGVLAFAPIDADRDADGLRDALEGISGLDPQVDWLQAEREGVFGDADGDGVSNGVEARRGLPLNSPDGIITWEVWNKLEGRRVRDLGRSGRFTHGKKEIHKLDTLETPRFFHDHYGSRIRGFIVPPLDGFYTFFLTGNNQTRLYLSPTDSPFDKELVARVPLGERGPEPDEWFGIPKQSSERVYLKARKRYYLEVIHKEDDRLDFFQVAWARPGASEIEVIQGEHWAAYSSSTADLDEDSLPDTWERRTGVDATQDRATQVPRQHEYGNPDNDGLTNFEEWQIGTHPLIADTDGDGVTDGAEVNKFGTNPLLPPQRLTESGTAIFAPELTAFSSALGDWTMTDEGTLAGGQRRGWLQYEFVTPHDGHWVYEIEVSINLGGNRRLPVTVAIDGHQVGAYTVAHPVDDSTLLDGRTGFLAAGRHTLEIRNENVTADLRLEIHAVRILDPGGDDLNGNGVVDWLERAFAAANGIETQPESLVSPACVEGSGAFLDQIEIETSLGDTLTVTAGLDGHWYADMPLAEHGTTVLTGTFEGGAHRERAALVWTTTEVSEHDILTIRSGDSLKLTAGRAGIDRNLGRPAWLSVVAVESSTQVLSENLKNQSYVICEFEDPGDYRVEVTDAQGAVLSSMEVEVVAPDFGGAIQAVVGEMREWQIPDVSWALSAQPDQSVHWVEIMDEERPRSAWVDPGKVGSSHVLARTSEDGAIAARGELIGLQIASVGATRDNRIVEIYENGDQLVKSSFVLLGTLPEGWSIEVRIRAAGFSFEDGTRIKRFYASDFDEYGIAYMRMVMPIGAVTKNCHSYVIFDENGNPVTTL